MFVFMMKNFLMKLPVTVSCFRLKYNDTWILNLHFHARKLAPIAAAPDHPLPVAPMKHPTFCSRIDTRRERAVNVHVVGQLFALAFRLFVNRFVVVAHRHGIRLVGSP